MNASIKFALLVTKASLDSPQRFVTRMQGVRVRYPDSNNFGIDTGWRHLVHFNHTLDRATRAALTTALNDIWLCADDEGKALIRGAADRNGGRINFVPGGRNIYDDTANRIEISLDAAGRTVYRENGIEKHASFNGVIVHELFHAADPNPSVEAVQHYVRNDFTALLRRHGYSDHDIAQAQAEVGLLQWKWTGRYFVHGLMTVQLERVLHAVSLQGAGFPVLSKITAEIMPEEFIPSLINAGIVGPGGTKPWEERAVQYTDAFMGKNYGNREPQRGYYANGRLMEAADPVRLLTHTTQPTATAGFAVSSACSFHEASVALQRAQVVQNYPLPENQISCVLATPSVRAVRELTPS